ncbi:MAG TPA: iron-sulfur cluster assembly protein, partial [Thermoplasmata archaeon]|nr:iron-sulfur cluster assembly protein [Thermoplasmata archaeon]
MVTKDDVITVLKKCYDPEIPINIYDLGLVYSIDIKETESVVGVRMT